MQIIGGHGPRAPPPPPIPTALGLQLKVKHRIFLTTFIQCFEHAECIAIDIFNLLCLGVTDDVKTLAHIFLNKITYSSYCG